MKDWTKLLALSKGQPFSIRRVHLIADDVEMVGDFALPPLAMLQAEDQLFISAFVRVHGSIKKMEELYGLSYPTIKNRLNRLGKELGKVQDEPIVEEVAPDPRPARKDRLELLDKLASGTLNVEEMIDQLKGEHHE